MLLRPSVIGARYPSGKGEVCKTFMRRFDSDPRLQYFPGTYPDSSRSSSAPLSESAMKKFRSPGMRSRKAVANLPWAAAVREPQLRVAIESRTFRRIFHEEQL